MVIVLSARNAWAKAHNYMVKIGGHYFGFHDRLSVECFHDRKMICLGPIGSYDVPFTATQGLIASLSPRSPPCQWWL
jgi:hypothetical protein